MNEPSSSLSIRHFVTAQGCPTLLGLGLILFNRCVSYPLPVEAYFRPRNLIELPAYSDSKRAPNGPKQGLDEAEGHLDSLDLDNDFRFCWIRPTSAR